MPERQTTQLLFVGDMHLGRVSGRIPPGLAASGLDPRAAWRRTVAAAREHAVQAVVLAGDVVDGLNARFEAFGPLSDGVRELLDASIRVLAVAGNHDGDALPRLADRLPGFELLGRGGRWEVAEIAGPGGTVRVAGWSFPAEHHAGDPLRDGVPAPRPGAIDLGVLHTELDTAGGRYAPTTTAALRQTGHDLWLLGHEHRPTLDPRRLDPGYLGSLVGLDPTETGAHGPWLVQAGPGGLELAMLPLAPLRWEELTVDVGGIADDRDLEDLLLEAVAGAAAHAAFTGARAVGFRVRLVGRTRHLARLTRALDGFDPARLVTQQGGVALFVDAIGLEAVADHDLETLARADDPAGLLARSLLQLRDGEGASLVTAAHDALRDVDRHFSGLDPGAAPPDDQALRTVLIRAGERALDALLEQREDAGGPR